MDGSGSTGSSLLKNILNRHEEIYAPIETSLFTKKELYVNWSKYKSRILKTGWNGLRSYGWHRYNGVDINDDFFDLEERIIQQMIADAQSFQAFADTYFGALKGQSASIWIEKTPLNAYCFRQFLDGFDDAGVIHMVRNPYDAVASLVRRGFDVFYAVGIYLLNTAAGLAAAGDNYVEVKYESLIHNTEEVLNTLSDFLGVKLSKDLTLSQDEVIPQSKLPGWAFDETESIRKQTKSTFDKLSVPEQQRIINALHTVYINKSGKRYFDLKVSNIQEICETLGYAQKFTEDYKDSHLRKLMWKDRWTRIRRLYPTGFAYPLSLKDA